MTKRKHLVFERTSFFEEALQFNGVVGEGRSTRGNEEFTDNRLIRGTLATDNRQGIPGRLNQVIVRDSLVDLRR